MRVRFDHLSRLELDREHSPSLSAKDAGGTLARHVEMTKAALASADVAVLHNLAYGPKRAERFDLIRPAGQEKCPCLIFVHGGFWQEGSKAGSGFAALALVKQGWASALVGYTLAPQASLADILAEIARAVIHIATHATELGLDPANLVLAGHSAGGHLAAAILAGKAGPAAAKSVAGAILISGVYDLAPVAASYVNEVLGLSPTEAEALSVLDTRPLRAVPVHLLIGGDETQSFLDQTDALATAWANGPAVLSRHTARGRDHFDVLESLSENSSSTFAALLAMRT